MIALTMTEVSNELRHNSSLHLCILYCYLYSEDPIDFLRLGLFHFKTQADILHLIRAKSLLKIANAISTNLFDESRTWLYKYTKYVCA